MVKRIDRNEEQRNLRKGTLSRSSDSSKLARDNKKLFELDKKSDPYEKALSKTDIDVLVNSLRTLLNEGNNK